MTAPTFSAFLAESAEARSPSELGVSTVYRTERPAEFYRGLAIWGKGRYYSLTRADSERINAGGPEDIRAVELPDTLRLLDFDLTWGRDAGGSAEARRRSDADYERLHELVGRPPRGVDGFVVRSHSLQYGYSQVVIFPRAQAKLSAG